MSARVGTVQSRLARPPLESKLGGLDPPERVSDASGTWRWLENGHCEQADAATVGMRSQPRPRARIARPAIRPSGKRGPLPCRPYIL